MQDPQSLHKYTYVHGDPIMGIDPTGEFFVSVGGLLGALAFVATALTVSGLTALNVDSAHQESRASSDLILSLPVDTFIVQAEAFGFAPWTDDEVRDALRETRQFYFEETGIWLRFNRPRRAFSNDWSTLNVTGTGGGEIRDITNRFYTGQGPTVFFVPMISDPEEPAVVGITSDNRHGVAIQNDAPWHTVAHGGTRWHTS